MVDYFVDLVAATNGAGTAASPWNQFTATENAGVVDGDNIWFKRVSPAVNTKSIAWKGAIDPSSKINYIGWPKEGDVFYEARPEDLKETWDVSTDNYVKQAVNYTPTAADSKPAAVLESNLSLHRFNIRQEYNSYNYARQAIKIVNCAHIDIYNCYLFMQYYANSNETGCIYINNGTNIGIYNTILNHSNSGRYNSLINISAAEAITFSGCSLYYGEGGTTQHDAADCGSSTKCSYFYNAQIDFINTTFNMDYYYYTSGAAGYYYSADLMFSNSNITISGCQVLIDNSSYSTMGSFPTNVNIGVFRIIDTNFNFIDSNIYSTQIGVTNFLIQTGDQYNVNIENVHWEVLRTKNIFADIRNYSKVTFKNITGSLYESNPITPENVNYFIAFLNWNYIINNDNIIFDNVQYRLGYILDMDRSETLYSLKLNNTTNAVLKHNIVFLTRIYSIYINNSEICGFYKTRFSGGSGAFIYGNYYLYFPITIKNSIITDIPIVITSDFYENIDILIYNCTGAGTYMFSDSNNSTTYSMKFKSIRNKNFSSLGTIKEHPFIEAQSILDNFSNGISYFTNDQIAYQTSSVSRTSGAGYSIEINKKTINGDEVTYPRIGDDQIWVYLPSAGTHIITAYLKYKCTEGALEEGDIKLGVDIINEFPQTIIGETLIIDEGSVWTDLPDISSALKLQCSVTITQPQYCPVRLYMYKTISSLIIYFDPKIVLT